MQQFYIYLQFRTKSPGTFDSPGHWSQPMLTPTSTDPALAWSDLHAGHLKTPGSNARPGTPQDAIWHQELWGVSGPVSYVVMFGLRLGFFLLFPKRSKKIQKVWKLQNPLLMKPVNTNTTPSFHIGFSSMVSQTAARWCEGPRSSSRSHGLSFGICQDWDGVMSFNRQKALRTLRSSNTEILYKGAGV